MRTLPGFVFTPVTSESYSLEGPSSISTSAGRGRSSVTNSYSNSYEVKSYCAHANDSRIVRSTSRAGDTLRDDDQHRCWSTCKGGWG